MNISSLLIMALTTGCLSNDKQKIDNNKITSQDTTSRPPNVSKQATLINFGGDEMPVLVWVEYAGPLVIDGKGYSHIQGIKFSFVKPRQSDKAYYENLEIRNGSRDFDFKRCRVAEIPGDANICLVNGKDSLLIFQVSVYNGSKRVHRGIEFRNMSTISLNQYGEYVSDVDMEFNIQREDNGIYTLTLNDGSRIIYKGVSDCNVNESSVSFLNREDGKIYLLNKTCYLELVNKNDAKKFQQLR